MDDILTSIWLVEENLVDKYGKIGYSYITRARKYNSFSIYDEK